MLTLRELLQDLEGVELVCGEEGADQPVRWVHISELKDPTPWLSGGELLLTTGLQLNDPDAQRAFVHHLADHQLCGLGLGLGFAHETVPEALQRAAEERSFPIISIPYETPFIAITEAAFTRLVNDQYAVLRRSIAAQERLERIVLSERGLDAIVSALSSLTGGAVLVLDARGEVLGRRAFRRPLEDEAVGALRAELRDRVRRGERAAFAPAAGELTGRALALPVAGSGGRPAPQAWLVAIKDAGGPSELDRLTLHQAATVVALELLRSRVAEETARRLAGDVLSAVASGELAGPDLARRLEAFGLGDTVGAFVVAPPEPRAVGASAVENALAGALRAEAAAGLVASASGLVGVLLPGMAEDELFALAERLRVTAGRELGVPLRAGAGRAVESGAARRAFHEARCALEARALGAEPNGNGAPPDQPVATYRDLGSFQLLLALQDDDALRLFCDSVLGPLQAEEGPYGDELLRSLEAFIEENGQWERAAKRLYCHRHTLRYRVRRIEELTGRSLSSARDRIEFWLALRGRELVS